MDLKHIPNVIVTCVVLHNICEMHKEEFTAEWLVTHNDNWTMTESVAGSLSPISDPSAEDIRDTL